MSQTPVIGEKEEPLERGKKKVVFIFFFLDLDCGILGVDQNQIM